MRKGFLNGPTKPVTQKENKEQKPTKDESMVAKVNTKDEPLVDVHKTTSVTETSKTLPLKQKREKRRRTRTRSHGGSPSPGRGFFVPGYNNDEGVAKAMSMNELMDASKGLTNMALAHEIAVDKDFALQKLKPTDTMEQKFEDMMHKAFWDLLAEQLKTDPPEYDQALLLLMEVKQMIFSVLLPQHKKLKDNINEVLDIDLIKQQIEAGVLEFEKYAGYILGLMAKLCAPVRDEQIEALKEIREVVPLFKGIMETLEEMKLDMANFTIQQVRPLIVSQSVDYEKIKFMEFLEKQKEDGLAITKEWLMRHAPNEEESQDPKYKKLIASRILNDAYAELLDWDSYNDLPETLVMDGRRILALRDQVDRIAISTAVILLTFSNVSSYIIPADSQKLKNTIKKHIDILLVDFHEDTPVTDLLQIFPGVASQVVKDIDDYLVQKNKEKLNDALVENLTSQIYELEDPNQRIRCLIQKRIIDFNKEIISGSIKSDKQVPPGLSICQTDLVEITGQFVRLVNYNKKVFREFYNEIIENHCLFQVE